MAREQKPVRVFQAIWPSVLLALVGIPLALELVAPNPFYGVRTSTTLASMESWYRSNFYAGVVAVLGGTMATIANLAIVRSPRLSESRKLLCSLGTTLVAVAAMAIAGLAAS